MTDIFSDRFEAALRDYTTPIVVVAEFYAASYSLRHYQVFSVFPFELQHFINCFDKHGYPTVTFVGLLPAKSGNEFSRFHIVTL